MPFQHSPYPTSSAHGVPGVLTRSQRRRQQEVEGLPRPHQPFVANPTTSAENEGSSAVFEEVRCYLCIRELALNGLHLANHIQPMAIDLENVRAVVLEPSTSTGPRETTGKGRPAASHEVRTHAATLIADAYRSHQVPGDIQPVPTLLGNLQDAHMDSVAGPAQIAADTIGHVDTAMTQSDAITTTYRQTLSTFSTVVNGITRVRHPNGRRSTFTNGHAQIHPSAQMALSALNRASKVCIDHISCH